MGSTRLALGFILRDAAKTPLLRMRSYIRPHGESPRSGVSNHEAIGRRSTRIALSREGAGRRFGRRPTLPATRHAGRCRSRSAWNCGAIWRGAAWCRSRRRTEKQFRRFRPVHRRCAISSAASATTPPPRQIAPQFPRAPGPAAPGVPRPPGNVGQRPKRRPGAFHAIRYPRRAPSDGLVVRDARFAGSHHEGLI